MDVDNYYFTLWGIKFQNYMDSWVVGRVQELCRIGQWMYGGY